MATNKRMISYVLCATIVALSFSAQEVRAISPVLAETAVITSLTVPASSGNKVIGAFSVTNPNITADTINQFSLENKILLTAVAADIASAAIYTDSGTIGVIDGSDALACAEATTTTVTNFDAGGSTITFTCSSPIAIAGLATQSYTAVITTSAGASNGRTMAASINANLTSNGSALLALNATAVITIDTLPPSLSSATLQNSTITVVELAVSGSDLYLFESSGLVLANATDRSRITYNGTNPTIALITPPNLVLLTFPISIGTAKSGGSLTFDANTVQDLAGNENTGTLTVADGSMTDSAAPVYSTIIKATAGTDKLRLVFSEGVSSTSGGSTALTPSDFIATGTLGLGISSVSHVAGDNTAVLTFNSTFNLGLGLGLLLVACDLNDIYDHNLTNPCVLPGQDIFSSALDTTGPTLTDGAISVTGASGTGGAFKVGDTVTVRWNVVSEVGGIADLGGATADLSQFGGGSAVAMTDTTACGGTAGNGIYEACYLIAGTEGISGSGKFANVTATDTLNNVTGPVADTSTFLVDTVIPSLSTFTSTTPDGSYGPTDTINVTATYSENLAVGSTATVVLDNGASVTLNTISTNTLSGTYTVGATNSGDDSSDLTVASITSQNSIDAIGNSLTSTALPITNIGDGSNIVIDTTGPNGLAVQVENTTDTTVDLVITGTELISFVGSGTATADSTDRASITYRSTNPSAAVIDNATSMTLTFPVSIGSDTSGSVVIGADTIQDALINANSIITIVNSAITDAAAPIISSSTPVETSTSQSRTQNLVLHFSEPMNTGTVSLSDNDAHTDDVNYSQTWSNGNKTLTATHDTWSPSFSLVVTVGGNAASGSILGLDGDVTVNFTTVGRGSGGGGGGSNVSPPSPANSPISEPQPIVPTPRTEDEVVEVQPEQAPEQAPVQEIERPAVILYQHINFSGHAETIYLDDLTMRDNLIGNDQVSSIQLTGGAEVWLFEHSNFGGKKEIFTANDADLRNNYIGNDVVSSLRVLDEAAKQALVSRCLLPNTISTQIHLGVRGVAVSALQRLFICLGTFPIDIPPTGYFGPITRQATILFQREHGLAPTGVTDRPTRGSLNAFLAP